MPITKINVEQLKDRYSFVKSYEETVDDMFVFTRVSRNIPIGTVYMFLKEFTNGCIKDIDNSYKTTFQCFFYITISIKGVIENFILKIYDSKGTIEFTLYNQDEYRNGQYTHEEMIKILKKDLPSSDIRKDILLYIIENLEANYIKYKDNGRLQIEKFTYLNEEFEKHIPAIDLTYGYKNGKVYEKTYYDEEEIK